ncbi:hypothetical protein RN001_003198 [Aquatica leii]|uniref:Galectin n=1 Tax=Aquatica leii TaxID=1421715 RepID=A0AAN7Q9B2_9COLE|nr:hypothetical protein RN001_003198 [Aquatica leii]
MAKTENEETNVCFCCCFPKPTMPNKGTTSESVLARPERESSSSKVPFSGDLPNELSLGNVIVVTGFVLPNCIRFSVNLTCGEGPDADIAFHFNPRLDRNCIVRNCRKRGRWDQEEISSVVKPNIERNKTFEIAIFVAKEEFLVSVNGKHFCAFTFRIPLNLCKRVEVHGLVDVTNVEHKLWSAYPEVTLQNPLLQISHGNEALNNTSKQLTVPLTGHLPKGFQEGWQLEINGRVKLLPHSFYINLQDGAQLWPHPIIPLHLNPRFNTSSGEDIFIRNARCDGHWGPEERTRNFQFSPGSPFNLAIRRGFDRFSVWIDGQLSGEFKYRGNADNINTVYIQGDVVIKNVAMHEKIIDFLKK